MSKHTKTTKKLTDIPTKDLVAELTKREGVEAITLITPDDEVVITRFAKKIIYHKQLFTGPQIILRVFD